MCDVQRKFNYANRIEALPPVMRRQVRDDINEMLLELPAKLETQRSLDANTSRIMVIEESPVKGITHDQIEQCKAHECGTDEGETSTTEKDDL